MQIDYPKTLRISIDNPNHHLWDNNGTWFIHYTIHPTFLTKKRIRHSLRTKSLAEARRRRDEIFADLSVNNVTPQSATNHN